jgi:uncharacterized membrane protein
MCAGAEAFDVRIFFLSCGIVTGIFGAVTPTPKTLLLQILPAAASMAAALVKSRENKMTARFTYLRKL